MAVAEAGALCPQCGGQTIHKCCNTNTSFCQMLRCSDKDCGTVLDYRRGLGTSIYGVASVKGSRQPFRLIFNRVLKMWQRRADGDGVPGTQGYRS